MAYAALLSAEVDFADAGFMKRLDALHRSRSDLAYDRLPLVLLGAGSVMAQSFVRHACETLNVVGVVDNVRVGETLFGHPVIGDDALKVLLSRTPDAVGVLCAGGEKPAKHFQAVWGDHPGRLLFYFEVMPYLSQSLSGNAMFNELKLFSDRAQIADIHAFGRDAFPDAESQRVLNALLTYRLTWDAAALHGIARPGRGIYLDSDLCPIGTDEILVDGGAYDGDTIRSFLSHTGGQCRHIHAFDLDPVNFAVLQTEMAARSNVTCHAVGLWSHSDTVSFNTTGAMGSRIDASGTVTLPVAALDSLGLGEVTFIKLDIEGAEGPALMGMHQTIAQYKPKLAISAYHKADDLITMVKIVRDIRPDYRFELRHYSGMIWDSLIYVA